MELGLTAQKGCLSLADEGIQGAAAAKTLRDVVNAGKIYWSIPGDGKIQTADLDGANVDALTELDSPRYIDIYLE